MSLQLSVTAQALINEIGINPQIILEIEGLDLIFGAMPVLKTARWDDDSPDAIWDGGATWDGKFSNAKSRDWISLDETTTNITQQISPDKGSTSSISTVNIAIIDKNGEVSKAVSFDNINDILGRKATFSIGFAQGAHPEDSNPIFRGVVVDFFSEVGKIMISLASPESLKRQVILEKFQTDTTSYIQNKQVIIQELQYSQRPSVGGLISIEYVYGAALAVLYQALPNKITVTIVNGVTKAKDVKEILNDTIETYTIVQVDVVGNDEVIQIPQALTTVQTDTVINVIATDGIVDSGDALKSYVKIDDEIMEVLSRAPTSLTVLRGQLNTISSSHDTEASVETFYRLQGRPIELALKLMLSNNGNTYFTSLDTPSSVEFISLTESIPNAIIFDHYNIQEKTGLTVGDYVQLDSPSNTGTYTIDYFKQLADGGSCIVVNETLNQEIEYINTFNYKSKYNTLNVGLGMLTSEVDVEQFELIDVQYGNGFVGYDIYIKDTIDDAKEFIDRQIFFPQGLYSIPRKARTSVKFVAPPFSADIVPYISTENVLNASKIKQRRSVHKYHYNTFVYRYNVDSIEDKYLTGKVIISADSLERIPVGKKQLRVESDGLRNTPDTTNMINSVGQRQLDRYQYAPTYFDDVEVNYKTGYALEVGDVVPFGGLDLKVTDLQTGNRGTKFSLFEIVNKSLNVKNGNIKLSLVSTAFDISSRYAVIGLSSVLGVGSSVNRIRIERFLDTEEFEQESDKWLSYKGQIVAVRSTDYSYYHEVKLKGVDNSNNAFLLLDEDLPSPPLSGYIVEPADYIDTPNINDRFKIEFAHFNSQVVITNAISQTVLVVDDATKLKNDSFIVVNSSDYTRDSLGKKLKIDAIVGNQITLDKPIGFLPLVGDLVNNSNYQDDQAPYVFI